MEKRKRENGHLALEVDEQLYGGPGTSEREKRQGKPGKVNLGLCPVSDRDNGNTEKGNVRPLPLELRKAGELHSAVTGKHCRGWTKPSGFWEEEHISLIKGIVSIVASLGHHQVNRISWGRGSWPAD